MSVTNPYAKQYGHEVHSAYLRMGSKLRNTVRTRNNVGGAVALFENGTGEGAECHLFNTHAGDWLEKLDEIRAEHDDRSVLVNAGAYALGRKTDELIIAELDKSTNYPMDGTTRMSRNKALAAVDMLGDVEDDDNVFAFVSWKQWSDMINEIPEFAGTDYVGPDDLFWRGTQAKRWAGALWCPHSGLTKTEEVRLCHLYLRSAVGHACGNEVMSEITYHGTPQNAWFIDNHMSQGACIIKPSGVVTMRCLEP